MDAEAVEVRDLVVVRGGAEVLHRLSLSAASGEVTGLLGPSGCGKTTLLRALVGVQRIATGAVHVLGAEAGSPGLRRRIGYVAQEPSVYRDLTVGENLRFFAGVLGVARNEVARCLEAVDLRAERDRLVGQLSGGQRSRVSLAAALLARPAVLILDEPTVGLDPVLRRALWQTFHALAAEGCALIVSSHVMDEASRCDRLLLMRDGQLIADDSPVRLLERTGTTSVEEAFLSIVTASR